jgi:AcrR family transcriptional regulator
MLGDHRERLIAAMAASVEERGYADTTVADVVRIARTSRRTFYQHFQDLLPGAVRRDQRPGARGARRRR